MAQAKKAKTGTGKKAAKSGKAAAKRSNVPAKIAEPKAKRRTNDAGGADSFLASASVARTDNPLATTWSTALAPPGRSSRRGR